MPGGPGAEPAWRVELTSEADRDLRRLRKRKRPIHNEALVLMQGLETDPFIGDACHPPLTDVRRIHFGGDKYRLVWLIVDNDKRVDILAVAAKEPTLYERVHDRLLAHLTSFR